MAFEQFIWSKGRPLVFFPFVFDLTPRKKTKESRNLLLEIDHGRRSVAEKSPRMLGYWSAFFEIFGIPNRTACSQKDAQEGGTFKVVLNFGNLADAATRTAGLHAW